jgi:hypothetical protein
MCQNGRLRGSHWRQALDPGARLCVRNEAGLPGFLQSWFGLYAADLSQHVCMSQLKKASHADVVEAW